MVLKTENGRRARELEQTEQHQKNFLKLPSWGAAGEPRAEKRKDVKMDSIDEKPNEGEVLKGKKLRGEKMKKKKMKKSAGEGKMKDESLQILQVHCLEIHF